MHIRPSWTPEPVEQSIPDPMLAQAPDVGRLLALTALAAALAVAAAVAAADLGWLPSAADEGLQPGWSD